MSNNVNEENDLKKDEEINSLKSVYQIAIETRNFEIANLIQRNNFFMIFQGVLLAGLVQAEQSRPYVEFFICITGICVSYYQMQMASGAKYWQDWWETRVIHFEQQLCDKIKSPNNPEPYKLFHIGMKDVEKDVRNSLNNKNYPITNCLILKSYSVGRAPIKVAIALLLTWLVLLLSTLNFDLETLIGLKNLVTGFTVNPSP